VVKVAQADLKFMRRALFLAQNRAKYASPNPRVGAVLVQKGRIVAEGATQPYGGSHAERVVLRKASARAKGATLYVTLEPCGHYGKTPPCANAIIQSGVRKVVVAMKDPFPLVNGRGLKILRDAGIQVRTGLLEKEAKELNLAFLFSVVHRRPRVLLKAAMSLDGKIATVSGKSKWITGEKARRKTHELRAQADAILVGSRTALKDNPSLTVRLPGYRRSDGWPLRVILDSRLRLGPGAMVFQGHAKTVLFTSRSSSKAKESALVKRGAAVFRVPSQGKMLSLKAVLRVLHLLQVRSLLVEGGGEVFASFLREKQVDEVALFVSPKIFGGKAPSWVGGKGIENPNIAPYLKDIQVEKVGTDFLLTGKM
jgi:diaminohydroxyphosphoribosylaminopyrimidine deaminase / 5-amino-6-(5-phosphoribosylamino)uracil reductase